MANVLKREKQILCLKMLCDGNSLRAVERCTGVQKKTVTRLMVRFGKACADFLDTEVRDVETSHLELDEQWTWVGKKNKNLTPAEKWNQQLGDQYLFLAQDQASRLIVSHRLGKRTTETTQAFMDDLAARIVLPENPNVPLSQKPQISTDGFNCYPPAVYASFGSKVQHGVIIKNYENEEMGRYAPPEIVKSERRRILGIDDLLTICTSHIERFNCTTRQFVKRFTRLTLAFSKKLENLEAAAAMHIANYNYNYVWRSRENDDSGKSGSLRTPAAMQAGLVDRLWKFEDLYEAVL